MSLMLISSSLSETGCSTFSLANFFLFSTSSLLSFSKCSRNLSRGVIVGCQMANLNIGKHVKVFSIAKLEQSRYKQFPIK